MPVLSEVDSWVNCPWPWKWSGKKSWLFLDWVLAWFPSKHSCLPTGLAHQNFGSKKFPDGCIPQEEGRRLFIETTASDYIIHTHMAKKKYTEYNQDYWQQEARHNVKTYGLEKQFQSSRNPLSTSYMSTESFHTIRGLMEESWGWCWAWSPWWIL